MIDATLELEITEKVKAEFTEDNLSQRVGWVRQCLHNRDLLTVFELDSRNSASDVDMAILKALLKGSAKQMFYLTTHSTHFIYCYIASDI